MCNKFHNKLKNLKNLKLDCCGFKSFLKNLRNLGFSDQFSSPAVRRRVLLGFYVARLYVNAWIVRFRARPTGYGWQLVDGSRPVYYGRSNGPALCCGRCADCSLTFASIHDASFFLQTTGTNVRQVVEAARTTATSKRRLSQTFSRSLCVCGRRPPQDVTLLP